MQWLILTYFGSLWCCESKWWPRPSFTVTVWSFLDSFHLDDIHGFRCPEAFPQHNSPITVFHSGDNVLYTPLASFSKHKQRLWHQRSLILSHLSKGHTSSIHNLFPGCSSHTSVWYEGVSSAEVFLEPHNPFMCRILSLLTSVSAFCCGVFRHI